MKQTRLMSFLESTLSTVIGFGVALATQILVFPLFGFHPTMSQNVTITVIFTAVSVVRQFLLRRLFEALHIRRPLTPFMQAVVAERFRQIEIEGFSPDHDNKYPAGVLAVAGAAYAIATRMRAQGLVKSLLEPPSCWPWSADWWKPVSMRRDLVKSCALIIAEGERCDRQRQTMPDSRRDSEAA